MRIWISKAIRFGTALLALFWAQVVAAGILATTSEALPGYQGTRTFSAGPVLPPFLNDEINVSVDFAVFEPDNLGGSHSFDDFLDGLGVVFAHGVPASHYVYAYQLHILTTTTPSAQLFTVGTHFSGELGGSAPSYIPVSVYGNGGAVAGNGDENSTKESYQGTSALWEFTTIGETSFEGNLDEGEWSAVLFFSSTDSPTWDTAQVTAGNVSGASTSGEDYAATGLGGTGVPTPFPEPGTCVLLGLGLLVSVGLGRRGRGTVD